MRREAHRLAAASFAVADDRSRVWHDTFQYALLAHEWASAPSGPPATSGPSSASGPPAT